MAFVRFSKQVSSTFASRFANPDDLLMWAKDRNITVEPLDVAQLAQELGLVVRYEVLEDQISGKLANEDGQWIVTVNSLHHPHRQRFTIAHELAHFMLHTESQHCFEDTSFFRGKNSVEPIEKDANAYAAKLLMPKKAFDEYVQKCSNIVGNVAQHFQVSSLAVRYRAKDLGYRGHNL